MKSLHHPARTLLALLLAATLTLPAQSPVPQLPTQLDDPANLTGERVSPQDPADTLPINHGALALQQLLRKLRTRASFMLIVAHPDDEDGGMLTYLSRGQGARVAMLTLNRGEGGQNLMSADFDDALGLIRTQELLAADRYMAVDQFFGTEVDFGFSKTKEEAFAKWTHERVLYDAVRCVR
ncbi:MAG: PIG-L family deacetylase, partial [Acidobacteriaceae bacterium]